MQCTKTNQVIWREVWCCFKQFECFWLLRCWNCHLTLLVLKLLYFIDPKTFVTHHHNYYFFIFLVNYGTVFRSSNHKWSWGDFYSFIFLFIYLFLCVKSRHEIEVHANVSLFKLKLFCNWKISSSLWLHSDVLQCRRKYLLL